MARASINDPSASRASRGAGAPTATTQFVRTPEGWRISSMPWDDKRPGLQLPERYAA